MWERTPSMRFGIPPAGDMTSEMTRLDDETERVRSYAVGLGQRLESLESEREGLPLETLSKLQQLRAFELEMLHQTSSLERRLEALEREDDGRGVAVENERLQCDVARLERQKESVGNCVAGLGKRLQALKQVNGSAQSAADPPSLELQNRLQGLRAFALEMLHDVSFLEKQLESAAHESNGTITADDADGEHAHLQQRMELLLGVRPETVAHSPLPEAGSSRRSSKSSLEDSREGLAGLAALMASSSRRSSKSSVEDNREGLAGLMRRSIEIQQSLSLPEGLLGKTSSSRRSSLSSIEDEHEGLAGLARKSMEFEDCVSLQRLKEDHEARHGTPNREGRSWRMRHLREQIENARPEGGSQRSRNLRESRRQLKTLREAFTESAASLEKEQAAFEAELAAIRARGSRTLSGQEDTRL